jgi:dTDP-4-dehydrorhamnose 3,5-epimerase
MTLLETPIPGLILMQPRVFGDERGYFFESLRRDALPADVPEFVQHNESMSKRGVLRGLHFQVPPRAQGKLVSVVRGSVYDVAVDIRVGSPTYGRHFGLVLDTVTKHRLYIPPGFAHGFLTLEDDTVFQYLCTDYYAPESEGCISYADADLRIDWDGIWNSSEPFTVSAKDQVGQALQTFQSPFAW